MFCIYFWTTLQLVSIFVIKTHQVPVKKAVYLFRLVQKLALDHTRDDGPALTRRLMDLLVFHQCIPVQRGWNNELAAANLSSCFWGFL